MPSRPAVASRHGQASMGPGQRFQDRANTFDRWKTMQTGAAPPPAPAPAPARAARPAAAPAPAPAPV